MEPVGAEDLLNWSVPRVLKREARDNPDRPFLTVVGEGTQTIAECYASAAAIAAVLSDLGVAPGDRVVVMAHNSLTAVHVWLAINLLGAADVFINTAYRGSTLEHAVNLVGATVLVAEQEFLPVLAATEAKLPALKTILCWDSGSATAVPSATFSGVQLRRLEDMLRDGKTAPEVRVTGRDTATIIFTSGTSGPAKGVIMPHAQAYALATQTVRGLRLTSRDIYFCFHPLFHTAGKFIGLYAGLLSGAHVIFDRRFDAAHWLDRIRDYRVTATLAHGAMLEMVFAQPERENDSENPLERFIASPFPRAIAERFERRFGARGIEIWGMTEINNPCWNSLDEPLRPGSCGKADPTWTEFRIVDPETDLEVPTGTVGEFVVRPRLPWSMMQGYMGMPEKSVEAWRNLWFHTGDSGYRDQDGYVFFVDRLGDRIRRRAENISSYDIESAVVGYPGIRECAAVGVASGFESDDDIKLCIVPMPHRSIDLTDLLKHLVQRLPHYMVPRYVELLDALPRTPTNKVRKAELRASGVTATTWDRKAAGIALKEISENIVSS
jgi:carnitine-CoA ligase